MSEAVSLHQMLAEAINEYCAKTGLGIPNGFVYCVSRIDNDGSIVYTLGKRQGQDTIISLGMAAYLRKAFECDVVDDLEASYAASDDEED